MKKEVNLIKKMKDKYGDIPLNELLKKLEEDNKLESIDDLRVTCKKIYGRGCNELSGESRDLTNEPVKDFILDIFRIKEDKEFGKRMPKEFVSELANRLLGGYLGSSCGVHYEDIELSHDIPASTLRRLISTIKVDEWDTENLIRRDFGSFF